MSAVQAALEHLTRFPLRRPGVTLLLALGLLAGSGLALSRLEYVVDVTEMLPTPAAQTLSRVARVFGLNERAYVLVESSEAGREEDLLRFARALEARLPGQAGITHVEFGLPLPQEAVIGRLIKFAPLYAEPDALDALLTPEGMTEQLDKQASRLALLGMGQADDWAERDPLDLHLPLAARARTLEGVFRTLEGSDHTLSADGRALLITVDSGRGTSSLGEARQVVAAIDAAVAATLREPWTRGLTVAGAGGQYVAEESERIITQDVLRSFSASLVLALVLLAFGLRLRIDRVLLLLVPTLWGTVVGAGCFALLRPSLAVLSLGCSAILIGLGVDFTVHVTAAALTQRASGLRGREAILQALRETRGALTLAALSSSAAFFAFLVADEQILRDMGLLTACGLLACLVGALGVLPVLLGGALRGPDARGPRDLGVTWCARQATQHPLKVMLVAVLVSVAALVALKVRPPGFESDLRNLQAKDSSALATQDRIEERFGASSEALVVLLEAEDEQAAVDASHRLEPALDALIEEGRLKARASIAALVPPRARQEACLKILRRKGPEVLERDLRASLDAVGFDPESFQDAIRDVRLAAAVEGPVDMRSLDAMGLGDVTRRFVRTHEGKAYALVLAYPGGDLWSGAEREALVGRLRAAIRDDAKVAGSVSGLALISSESAGLVEDAFGKIAVITVVAVLAGLLLRFRNPGRVLLVLSPAALGTLWTAGLFAAAGWKLNLMNLGVLPMILAIGVDDGIHVMHRAYQAQGQLVQALRGTAVAVLLTSLTTMVTFGSLALSENQGIASVGILSFFGVGCCLAATIGVLPAALTLLRREGSEQS